MNSPVPDRLEILLDGMMRSGLDVSVGGVLDALWLALQPGLKLGATRAAPERPKERPVPNEPEERGKAPDAKPETPGQPPAQPGGKPQPTPRDGQKSGVYAAGVQPGDPDTLPASPLRVPAASALAGKLPLSRSLRPLRKWYRNAQTLQLDEAQTVEETARAGGVLMPVMEPSFERWYELMLVADSGASMDIWQETLGEFEQMSRAAGVFRDIRRYRLLWKPDGASAVEDAAMLENADGVAIRASTLAQTNVRRLIFVATNGSGPYWADGRMAALLAVWSTQCSVAIVHMLPAHMWSRSRTGEPRLLLRTLSPGANTRVLDAEALSRGSLRKASGGRQKRMPGAVPILPLDPAWMTKWARMQMGGGQRVPAIIVGKRADAPVRTPVAERTPEQWEAAVRAFTMHASLEAQRLAVYLSSGPFTLPVARLVQAAKLGAAASQTQLAEVLLSGLVQRTTASGAEVRHEWVEYCFYSDAAAILRRGLRDSDTRDIADALEKHIERYWGKPVDFRALVYNEEGRSAIPKWAQPFVQLAGGLLGLPNQPEPRDDGRPTVFVMWKSPRWQSFGQEVVRGLEDHGFRVLVSGRHRVPRRGATVFIGEKDPKLGLLHDDYVRTIEHGLNGVFLLAPGTEATQLWMIEWDVSNPAGSLERLTKALGALSQEACPSVLGAPRLDRQRGLSPLAAELAARAREFTLVVYSNQEFEGLPPVRDIAWLPDVRKRYPAGVRWIRRGEKYDDAPQGQLLIFEKPVEVLRIPEGCAYIVLDPEFPAIAELIPGMVYEGPEEVARKVMDGLRGQIPSAYTGKSPHVAAVWLRLTRSAVWRDTQFVLTYLETLSAAANPIHTEELNIRTQVFSRMPQNLRDAAGRCAVLRDDAPFSLVDRAVGDVLLVNPLAEIDLLDVAGETLRASAGGRFLAREDPSWAVWNESVLTLWNAPMIGWFDIARDDDYFRRNLAYHATEAHNIPLLVEVFSDFRWWALRMERDGVEEFGREILSLPDELGGLRAPWVFDLQPPTGPREIARLITAASGELPGRLRTSAAAYLGPLPGPDAPPARFILVAGGRPPGGGTAAVRPEVLWAAEAIGKEIARRGCGLVCGLQPGSDQTVLKAFLAEMSAMQNVVTGALRIVTFDSDLHGAQLPPGYQFAVSSDQVVDSVNAADAVILLGGADWVTRVYEQALATFKPVYPVFGTQEAARQLFLRETEHYARRTPWGSAIRSRKDAESIARELVDRIAASPDKTAPPVPESLVKTWNEYLDSARDSGPLFDWRKVTPELAPEMVLQLLQSQVAADRVIAFTSFWLHPKTELAQPVVQAAVPVIEGAASMTELYIALGACNVVFLETDLFPARGAMRPLSFALEKAGPRVEQGETKRANDVRDRVHKLDQQLKIWLQATLLHEAVERGRDRAVIDKYETELGHLAPVYGKRELQNHLKNEPAAQWRLHVYAVLCDRPDADLTDEVINCLMEREDFPYAFELGLRALQAIVRGHPLTVDQWNRLQAMQQRLPESAQSLLDSLKPVPKMPTGPWATNLTRVIASMEGFDGRVAFMYRDLGGAVCVGVGHAIASPTEASELSWMIADRPATKDEVEADYAKVATAPMGLSSSSYETLTTCRMSANSINDLLLADVRRITDRLAASLPNWPSYPFPAQFAIFDMAHNLGIGGLMKFTAMLAAVDAGDWETAAQKSHRVGVPEARNQQTAALFREAAGAKAT